MKSYKQIFFLKCVPSCPAKEKVEISGGKGEFCEIKMSSTIQIYSNN